MQTRRTSPNHHHQEGVVKTTWTRSGPEAELIALAQGKGQILTAPTLRLIRDTLELRGVAIDDFVADVRPHFRNNILNPSGFLINRARRFQELSRPAAVSISSPVVSGGTQVCGICKGQNYILTKFGPVRNARRQNSGRTGRRRKPFGKTESPVRRLVAKKGFPSVPKHFRSIL